MRREHDDYYRYCVVSEKKKLVYIGASRAKDVQALLRRHVRGEVPETAEYFGPGPNQTIPILYKSSHTQEKEDAERLGVWNAVFLRDGYMLLHRDKRAAKFAMEMTTGEILKGRAHRTKSCGTEKKGIRQKFTAEAATTSFSMRIAHPAAARFRSLCRERGITQSQMLGMLIDEFTGINDLLLRDLDRRIEVAVAAIEDEKLSGNERVEKLQDKIKRQQQGYSIVADAVATQQGIAELSVSAADKLIPKYTNKQAKMCFEDRCEYAYPDEPGIMRIAADALYYGKMGRGGISPLFVCGRNEETGELVRFRYYPKREYVGISPMNPLFRKEGQLFVVGYTKAADNAMELLCAFTVNPRPITYGYLHAGDYALNGASVPWEKKRVEDLISDAENRSKDPKK